MGQPRGAVATRLLLEMNFESVSGDFVEESAEELLGSRPDFLKSFTLVIATELSEKSLKTAAAILWEANIPLMVVRSYGFIGYIRMQVR